MTYLTLSKKAEKEFKKLPKEYKKRISRLLTSLMDNPYIGKQLKGEYEGKFSVRVWPYRIIYRIDRSSDGILVSKIGHRQGIYK